MCNLIDAYWYLPREHSAVALSGIMERAAQLSDDKCEAILTKARGLDPQPDYVGVVDEMHSRISEVVNLPVDA